MWKVLGNIAKTATSFLQTGIAPPNTPDNLKLTLEQTNHLQSKKFFIVFSCFLILGFFYFTSVAILFMLPSVPEIISGYVTIFSKTIEVVSIVVAAYLGVQGIVDLKYHSSSSVINESISRSEKITIVQEYLSGPKEDDYKI
jgi:hypothetical protein